MAKRKKSGPPRRRGTRGVLADHKRDRQKLVPPLMQLAPLREHTWHDEMLPDFLWIACILGRRSAWRDVYSAMDVVDRFVPEGPRFADGRLSTFALVPQADRAEARAALQREAPHALPQQFGHALGLYPTCPALWLYEDWLTKHEPNPDVGIPLLRTLVGDHADKAGTQATRLRMAAFSRRVTHGKFAHPGTGAWELFPKYPDGLNASELAQVESALRATWLGIFGRDVDEHPEILTWPREFWLRNRELVTCHVRYEREERTMPAEDGPVDPEPLMHVSEIEAMLVALDDLGDQLRSIQQEVLSDPEADEPNAVLLGLASRMYRLLYGLLERPSAWTPDAAGLHMRPLVDTRILVGWLVTRNDPQIFAAYREHGLGRLKLLREHIKADLGDDLDDETQEMLERLDRRVNLERDEWVQPVNLGSFTDVTTRTMAIEAGLKGEYDLSYAPLSSYNHGEWPAVRENDTTICAEPLHRNHRVGAFRAPPRTLNASPALAGMDLARDGIVQIFAHYGRDVAPSFVALQEALHKAMYDDADET